MTENIQQKTESKKEWIKPDLYILSINETLSSTGTTDDGGAFPDNNS